MLLSSAAIFSNTQWTFWDVFFLFFFWLPLLMVWAFAFFDIFARRDLSGWAKALWAVGIIIFPWVGAIVYLLVRGQGEPNYVYNYYDVQADDRQPARNGADMSGANGEQEPVAISSRATKQEPTQ